MNFEFFISRRYLRVGQKQALISLISLLSIAGVAVGVMALIVVIAVMSGFEADLKTRLLAMQPHLVATPPDAGAAVEEAAALDRVRQVPGVSGAAGYLQSEAMLRSATTTAGVRLRGIDPAAGATVIDPGVDLTPLGRGNDPTAGIVLGRELARQLGVVEGDRLFLVTPRGMLAPIGHVPAMRPFRVVGRFSSGVYEFDAAMGFVDLDDARRVLRTGRPLTGIQIRLADVDRAEAVGPEVAGALGPGWRIRTWQEANQSLFAALKLEKTAMFVILALIVSVAALNIASALIMTVMEKAKDIAILKAMGASDRSVRRIFVINGLFIGALGIGIGSSLGWLICNLLQHYDFIRLPGDIYYMTRLPVRLAAVDVAAIAAAALLICLAATAYPAHQAARLDPVETIRYG